MTPTILLGVVLLSLLVSAVVALVIVRAGRRRALDRLTEVPGTVQRSIAATSLGLASLGKGTLQGTGTLVLTNEELAFAQWRPERLVRIPRSRIVGVDTTRSHLDKSMNADLLRVRWTSEDAGSEDVLVAFLRDLDPWLQALGGTRSPAEDA